MTTQEHRNRFANDDLPPYPGGPAFRDDEASRDGARKVNADGSCQTQCAFSLPPASSSPVMVVGDTICWRAGKRLHVLPDILPALAADRAHQSRIAA